MRPAGRLVTIRRSGDDGAHFPLSLRSCLLGRSIECDIRIQLPVVSKQHCKIEVKDQVAILYNFSSTNPTQVNGSAIHEPVQLKHGDVITIIDRSFRYEDESHQNGRKSPGLTGKRREQEQARRASRSSFSADPGAKGSDSKAHSNVSEGNASRKSLVHVGRLNDSSTWDGLEDSEGHVGHNDRNAGESTSGVLKEKSRVAVNCYRERKSCPVRSLDEGKKSESPFKKLYQSLKEELVTKSQKGEVDIKSQKQSVLPYRRKSVPPSDYARVKERETQLLLSHKPRPKSGGSGPVKAAASPELEAVQAEDPGGGVPSAQTSTEALSASPLNERAKVKTPARGSQPPRDEALHVTHSRESVSLDESEGIGVPHEILTPKKLVTRNLTPRKAEDAKPENTSSRKRRRTSAKVEGPPAEIHTQVLSTQRLAQCDMKTEKDAVTKPEKLGAATAAQMCSESPGLTSVDISNFGDSVHKIEGVSLKRRRVSFGGCLRPELFDENLPPNTPLKRGETPTKRRSLVTHTPVLKKIIKEQPLSSGKKEAPGICLKVTDQETCVGTSVSSPGVTPSRTTHDQRRRSGRASLASGDSKPPLQMDFAKKAARKSSILPSRRPSVSRSQHDILQMICSKRRSGASEANLIVAKSWADVVKLGTKQTQTKVVRHGLQRQMSKRQRRPSTPKKPTSSVHNQFSTGHANSPCTIVIGKAQIEKVNVPARPYRMLNNFVLNQKLDFSEDLSGLTEMFKTPAKEKQQQRRSRGSTLLSNSENLLGKHRQVTNLGEKPLPVASDILGANMPSSPLDAAKETSDQYFASPTLRRRSMKDGNTAKTPTVTHLEMKTPDSAAEPLKTVASTNKFRRSRQLRDAEMPPVESKSVWTEDLIEGFTGRRLRKTPLQGQEVKGEAPDSEQSLPRCKENVKSKSPETIPAMRRSRNGEPKGESTEDLSSSQVVLRTPGCVQEPAHGEEVTKILSESSQPEAVGPPESRRRQLVAPLWSKDVKEDLFASGRLTQASEESTCTRKSPKSGTPVWKGTTKQKVGPEVDAIAIRPRPRTPEKKTQVLEDLVGLSELFRTPKHDESGSDDETKAPCRAPEPSTAQRKVAMEGDLSAPRKLVHVSRGDSPMLRVPDHKPGRNKAVKESAKQIRDPAASANSSKRHVGKAKKAECLEDLTGFQELFQTPGRGKDAGTVDKTTTMPCISPQQGPGRTPRSTKRLPKISRGEAHVGAELSALGELTQAPAAPAQQERSTRALMETPERKPEPTGNLTGHKRRPQTRKDRSQSLEDLTGFQELFQTPGAAKDQVATGEIIKMSLNSPQPEPVRTPVSTKRLPKISLGKVVVKEEFSALREMTRSASKATPTVPRQEESGLKASTETPEQELDPSPRRRRRPHTPKRKYQLVEDLAGLQELFQTPGCANDLVTVHETPRMSLKSQPEPSRTPRNTKRLSKKSLGNVDVGEELLAPRKSTQSLGKVMLTPTEPVSQTKGTEAIMQTPEQKLEPTGNSSGPKRRPRTPKEKAQPLEDLAGFHELFQTPARASHPVAVDKTPRLSLNSLQADPVRTPASTKRLSKRSLGHVDVGEELWGYSTPPPMSGETTHTRQGPGEDGGLGASKQPLKRKLDPAARASGSKRLRRAPEEDTQPLEDLTGLQELFQTPARAQDPETIDETTQLTYRCPRTEPVITPRSTERLPRRSFGKVSVEGKVPAFRRLGQSPGKVTPTVLVQEQGAEGIADSPEQKLEPPENVTRRVRRSRTPKEKSQPLEDMAGFQELFQTPGHASDPATVDQTPMKSPQSERVRTFPRTKRLSKASLGNVEAPVRLSVLNKPTCASEEIILRPRLPEGDGRGSKDLEEPAPPTLDPAVRRTGSKKQRGARKEKAQPVEDLAGFQELFHTPRHGKEPVTVDKTMDMPCKSPQAEAMEMPVTPKRQPRTSLRKVHATKEPSGFEVLPPPSGKATGTSRVPGEHRGLGSSKHPKKWKLDPAARAPGSKRLRRAPEEETQPLEDLTGLQELFQTPACAQDPETMAGTSEVREAPEAVETSTWRPRTRLRTADVGGEPTVHTERSGTSRETRSRRREPVCDNRRAKERKESLKQKEELAASVIGRRRPPRALGKAQPLGQQASTKELPQTPDLHEESASHEKTTEMPCKSLQPEQRDSPAASKRPLRMRVCKVDMKEEPTAQRKPSGRDTRNAYREPTGNGPSAPEPKQSTKRKLDPAASAPGCKRPRRALKEERQLSEDLAGSNGPIQTPGNTEESLNDDKPTQVARNSSQPEKVGSPTASPRPRTRRGKADVQEEPLAARKTVRASRRTARSHQGPEAGDQGIQAPKEAAKLTLDTGASVTGGRRRLRTPKEAAQPLEVPATSREVIQISGHTELLNDSQSLSTPEQMPDRVKPLRARGRVLRAPKGSPVEVSVDTRDPSASHSNTSQTLTRTSVREGRVSRTRGLRSVAPVQETADEKPIYTQRTAPSERHLSPEPPKMKQLRIVTRRIELAEEQISNSLKSKRRKPKVEEAVTPDQKMSLRSRRQNTTNTEQQKPEVVVSAEKTELKRNEKKPTKPPQETELQNAGEEAKTSTSRGNIRGRRICLRSGGQREVSQPPAVEEKAPEKSVVIPGKSQNKKGGTGDADGRSLRSRKTGVQPRGRALDSEPEPRVTRAARKGAENPKKDKDSERTKKVRTRSHRDS